MFKINKLILAFAFVLAMFIIAPQKAMAVEPGGHSFCPGGIANKEVLRGKITRALAADPKGYRKLEGCYAAPIHFLMAFQHHDPGAGLTSVSDLPAYIDSWTTEVAKPADWQYNSDSLYEQPGGGYGVKYGGFTRDLKGGETIYKNPKTGKLVLLSGCANPGVTEVPPVVVEARKCLEIRFPSGRAGEAIRFAHFGRKLLPANECEIALKRASDGRKQTRLPEECPDIEKRVIRGRVVTIVCNWDAAEADASGILGYRVEAGNVSGSFYSRANGTNVLYLPREALDGETAICWELPDGRFVTKGVRRASYVGTVATITHEMVYGR